MKRPAKYDMKHASRKGRPPLEAKAKFFATAIELRVGFIEEQAKLLGVAKDTVGRWIRERRANGESSPGRWWASNPAGTFKKGRRRTGGPKPITKEVFLSRLVETENGCLEYPGSLSGGYPQCGHGLVKWQGHAHRVAWYFKHGPVPAEFDGKVAMVCHSCNNKKCANVDHLYLGNHKTNMDDYARGKYNPKRKLTTEQAAAVKKALSAGSPTRAVARDVGLSQRSVQYIRRGKTYRYD